MIGNWPEPPEQLHTAPLLDDDIVCLMDAGHPLARGKLDLARYADTNGYERDGRKPEAWRYRDYVIRALNQDMPYDRFLTEQIAGDLLPNPTEEQLVASGFNRLNMMTREGGAQAACIMLSICNLSSRSYLKFPTARRLIRKTFLL